MRGTRWIARWNGGLMSAKYRRDYSVGLDWRWANSISGLSPRERIFRSGSRCRVPGNLFHRVERKRRNSQPAAFYDALLSYSNSLQPSRQQTGTNRRWMTLNVGLHSSERFVSHLSFFFFLGDFKLRMKEFWLFLFFRFFIERALWLSLLYN